MFSAIATGVVTVIDAVRNLRWAPSSGTLVVAGVRKLPDRGAGGNSLKPAAAAL
jgi:hypothetical protein